MGISLLAVSQKVFAGGLLLQVAGLGSSIVVSRVLGPHDRGILSSITLIALTGSSVAVAGFDIVIARRLASALQKKITCLWLHCLVAMVPVLIAVYFVSPAARSTLIWPWIPLLVLSSVFNNIAFQVVLALGKVGEFNSARIIFSCTYASAAMAGFFLGMQSVIYYIVAFVLSSVLATITLLRVAVLRPSYEFREIRLYPNMLISGAGFGVSAALTAIAANFVPLLCVSVFAKDTFGLVVVALAIVQVSTIIATSVSKGLFAVVITNVQSRITYRNEIIAFILLAIAACMVAMYALFLALSDKLVPLIFGPAFIPVSSSFLWFAIGGVFMSCEIILDEAIRAERAASIISFGRLAGMSCGFLFWFICGQQTLKSAGLLFALFNAVVFMTSYGSLLWMNKGSASANFTTRTKPRQADLRISKSEVV